MSANKKISVGWQVASALFIPTGLYASKRIKKLRYGVLIYGIIYGVWFGVSVGLVILNYNADVDSCVTTSFGVTYCPNLNQYASLTSFVHVAFFGASIYFPMKYIKKWSKEWNESIDRQNAQSSIM